jgi:5S rRNA maturation endonuclease (ribonuclease M5)
MNLFIYSLLPHLRCYWDRQQINSPFKKKKKKRGVEETNARQIKTNYAVRSFFNKNAEKPRENVKQQCRFASAYWFHQLCC